MAQTGIHFKRGAIPRLVPSGLSSLERVELATSIGELPLDCPAPLSLSTRFAVDMVVELGARVPGVRSEIRLRIEGVGARGRPARQ